jgi:hypothetical protein
MVREIMIVPEEGVEYIEGKLVDMWKTKLGHLNLNISDYSYLKNYDGNIIAEKCKFHDSNFIIPTRRTKVYDEATHIKPNTLIRIKLMRGGISETKTISDIQNMEAEI